MAADDLRGRRLGGFELREPLGEGSFGAVWKARQLRLDRDVAVKVLDPLVARDPNAARRFEREGRAAASLDHPSIVPVYEAGDDDGLYFLAMRLVDGETLADVIEREAPLDRGRVVELLTPIAGALDAAHAIDLIHRDVKPANILLEDGRPFLTDFGIAASTRELGRYTTGSIGTAEYMAPEQARNEPVDHRSDLYALGCVAYHALTGVSPFARDDMVSTLMAHSADEVPPTGDGGLDTFFARALAKDPDERFDRATELVAALGGGAAGPPMSSSERPGEPARRPVAWLAAGAALVAAVVAGAIALSGGGDDPDASVETSAPVTTAAPTSSPPAGDTAAPATSGPATTAATDVAALRSGGSIAVGTRLALDDPNPHSNLDVARLLAENVLPVMYRIDEQLDPVPSLATGPPEPIDGDPTRLRWTIHDDRTWDDGSAVTAADVVATYDYLSAADTNAGSTGLYRTVAAVRAVDATTLELDLTEPTGAAYLLFSTIHPIIQAAAWESHLGGGGTATDFLVDGVDFAAGPYQLATRQNPGEIALSRNPEWTVEPAPALDRIEIAAYPTSDALVAAQRSREVDMIWVDDVDRLELLDAAALPDTEVVVGTSNVALQLTMNLRSEPLADPLVRRAILHAIDRAAIADVAVGRKTDSIAEPWNSLVFGPGQDGNEDPFADTLDVDEANRLLDEAGWTRPDDTVFRRRDGEDLALTMVLLSDADSINTALAVEEALQGVGIDITGAAASLDITNERTDTGDFDLLLQFRIFSNDPVGTEPSFASDGCPTTVSGCTGDGVNVGAFADDEVDAALEQAAAENDPATRFAAYAEVDRLLREAVPAVPLYVEPAFTAFRDEIGGVTVAPNVGPIVSLPSWGFLAEPG